MSDFNSRKTAYEWTKEDDEQFRKMWASNIKLSAIAKKLGRPETSIKGRKKFLKLPNRKKYHPPKVKKPRISGNVSDADANDITDVYLMAMKNISRQQIIYTMLCRGRSKEWTESELDRHAADRAQKRLELLRGCQDE